MVAAPTNTSKGAGSLSQRCNTAINAHRTSSSLCSLPSRSALASAGCTLLGSALGAAITNLFDAYELE